MKGLKSAQNLISNLGSNFGHGVLFAIMALMAITGSSVLCGQTTFPSQIGAEVADRPTGFIDAFKDQGRLMLGSGGNPVATDANGNPLSDGIAVIFDNRPTPVWTGVIDDPAQYQPNCAGTYTISFQGQAVLSNVAGAPTLTFANQTYNATTNTTTVSVILPGGPTYSDGPALMEISFTNTQLTSTSGLNSGIAKLQVIRPGFTLTQAANPSQVFDPVFITAFAPFGYLRFMGWMGTNSSPGFYGDTGHHLFSWSSRSLPTDFYQGVGTNTSTNSNINAGAWGLSWEYAILLANAANKDIWINIPISATGGSDPLDSTYVSSPDTSSYIYNLALLLKNGDAFTGNVGLNPGLHIYIEHSNEVWNSGFLQYTWNLLAAEDEVSQGNSVLNNDGDTSQFDWAYRRHIKRLYEIAQIFQSVFGPGSLNTTIRPVYAWWQLDEGSSSNAANALAWFNKTYGLPSNYFYAMAQADYFNTPNYATDTTVPEVLSDMTTSSNASVQYVTAAKTTATQYGLQLFAYEGGPANDNGGTDTTTNTGIQILANRDPGMDTLLQNHIRTNWFGNGGGLYGYYSLSGAYSRFGDWGATDDYTNLTTAKYNALINLTGYTPNGVPFAPGDLIATAGNQSVALSWQPVPGAANYNVLRGAVSGAETQLATVSSPTYSDTAVSNMTTYYYVVKAANSSGVGASSNEASATPVAAPPPTSILTAAASNGQATLTWTAAAGATSYNVYEGTVSGGETATPIATGIALTTYTATGLTNGTPYYFEVAGLNALGTGSASNEAAITPIGPPPAPTNLTATAGSDQAVLYWTASLGATSYNIYEGATAGGESSTPIATGITAVTYTATPLTNGTPYYFTVAAANANGTSGYSNEAGVTPATPSTLLAYEPFGETAGLMNGAGGDGDFGWNAGWVDQGTDSNPGYDIVSTSPISFANLVTTAQYAVGGNGYNYIGRQLDVSAAGPFSTYLSSGLIGAPGQTIWLSFLMRKDTTSTGDSNLLNLTAQGGGSAWYVSPANVAVGFCGGDFGGGSITGSTMYWSLVASANFSCASAIQTNVPIVMGQPALMVMEITFGATNIVNLYVNPPSLGGVAPTTPSATYSTTNSLAFQSLTYYGGDGTGQSSLGDIRIGSSFAAVTPTLPPVIPGSPTNLTAAPGNALATLSWTAVIGATSYNVYEGTASGGEGTTPIAINISGTTYTATGLTNGSTYYFVIAAVNTVGTGMLSSEANVTPSFASGIPATPVLTTASGDSTATLSWNAVPGATSYNIYQATTSGGEGMTPIATGVTATTYAATGLTDETTYFFEVSAVNATGTSAMSNEAAVTPAPAVTGTNSSADFSIFPQVLAANPVRAGFNMQPAAGTNITENAWLADGGFSSYDARMSFTANQDGTANSFIAAGGGGTSFYSSITSGYFVGATAYTYRFGGGAWSLLRTDTVAGFTALDDSTPADNTITFAGSGPQILAGDIVWVDLDNQASVPGLTLLDPRFTTYCTNWNSETLNCDTRTATLPYTLSTDVPAADSGGLSLEITDANSETNGIWQYIQGAFVGPTAEEFQPGHTYEVNVWLKQSGISNGNVTFSIAGLGITHTFTGVTNSWQEFTWTFPAVAGLPANSSVTSAHLDFSAPGTMWVDNFQLFDAAWAPNTVSPQAMTAWQSYQPGTFRIWSNFGNAAENYSFFSLESWLTPEIKTRNTPGIGNQYELPGELEHLPDALANVKAIGNANPWLIVNMALSPTDWGNLIDYLAAPAGTGYAAMRPANHPGPYTDDFTTIYLEVGNEEWGTQSVPADTAYGQWAHFVISNAIAGKSYFNPSQIKFIANGFDLKPSFGSAAAAVAPEVSIVDAALYSQGNQALTGDAYYQSDLVQVPASNGPIIDALVAQQQLDATSGRIYGLASYEEGPGASTTAHNGDTSLAAAIGAVDVNLYASERGFGAQNLFMYQLGAGPYTSHSNFANGFRPHPVWEALQMRNNYCTGPIVLTTVNSVPTSTDGNAYPLIAVYTFRDANVANQADVVVISRDLNNNTPVTLHFPATPTGTANLYTLTGDPRTGNDQAMNIPIGSTTVSITANYSFNMPPGSMYVFQVPLGSAWSSNGQPTPPPPASLTASAGNGEVTLTWPASSGATSYNILRGMTSGGPYTQIGTSATVAFTDTTVTNGTTYYYVVNATNAGGTSNYSPEAFATPNVEDDAMTPTPPPLDGSDTGSWASASFIPMTHYFAGTSPDTAAYKTLWDNNYLYLLVSVQDPYLIAPTEANIYDGESVEVYFSGTDTRSTTYGPTDFQYAFPYGNGGAVITEADHSPTSLTGVLMGQQNITGGFEMAIALPWTTLGTLPVQGQQYGFDVMIDTASSQGTRIGKLAWWATQDSTWSNPSLMGPLVLTKPTVQPQTISFTVSSPITYTASPITLVATGGASGNPVTFSIVSGPGTLGGLNNSVLTITGVGTIVLAANQAGNASYSAAPQVTQSIVVNPAPTTITLTANPANPTQGQPDLLTATVTGAGQPGGTVVFSFGATTLCTATLNASDVGFCSFTPASDNNLTVTAQYQGDANHLASSATLTLFVYDSSVKLQLSSTQLVYPGATNVTACITPTTATGTVKIYDGPALLTTQNVQGGGCAYWYISPGLSAGTHMLTAVYSGDSKNPSGTSVPVPVTVSPVPVTLSASCWNASFPYGANYQCTINVSSNAGAPVGSITYTYDSGPAITVPLSNGNAQFTLTEPIVGTHKVVVGYAQQTNYAAATPQTETFAVTPAPVNVSLTPSSWYAKVGTSITFQAAVASWSAGPPNAIGVVSFYDGATLLSTVPVNASGQASCTTASLPAGTQTITATYSGGVNYASGSTSIVITLAQ